MGLCGNVKKSFSVGKWNSMEVSVGIFGKDYSLICFDEYDEKCNQGIRFEGIEYDRKLAQIIVLDFLKHEDDRIRRGLYKVEKNDKRTNLNALSLYSEYKDALYYQNVVGVLAVKGYQLSDEAIKECMSNFPEEQKTGYVENNYHITLQISSRFDGTHTYFLPTMFKCDNFEVNDFDVPQSQDDLFDFLLVFNFVRNLKDAYMSGVYRRYQRFQRNDDHVRGSIQVATHIRLNAGMQNGNIAYVYRENTVDNVMNHLILYTYMFMKKKFSNLEERLIGQNYECQRIINEIKNGAKSFGEIPVKKVMQQCSEQISQPFYLGYEKLRQTCMQVLNHMGISIFDGIEEDTTEGILFYMPDLWEDFLEYIMRQRIQYCDLETQMEVKVYQEGNQYKHNTYPDFVFFRDSYPLFVLDAKFKRKWEDDFDLTDYTKCIRDMNSMNVHATGVIYPVGREVQWSDFDVKHAISEYNQRDSFFKFPIHIPFSEGMESYAEWLRTFEESITKSISVIGACVEEERNRMC